MISALSYHILWLVAGMGGVDRETEETNMFVRPLV